MAALSRVQPAGGPRLLDEAFSPAVLGALERVRMRARHASGERPGHTPVRGRSDTSGTEVDRHTAYAPGDDLRRIDARAMREILIELPSERLALLGELGLVGEEPIDKREMALDRELRRLRLRRQLGLGLCRHLARRGLVLLLGRHQLGLQHGRALAQRLQFGPHRAHLLLHTRVDGVRELRRALRLLGAVRRRDPLCISRGASAAAAGGGRCR